MPGYARLNTGSVPVSHASAPCPRNALRQTEILFRLSVVPIQARLVSLKTYETIGGQGNRLCELIVTRSPFPSA